MPNSSFWKPETLDVQYPTITPMGAATKVSKNLLLLPRMRLALSDMTLAGYESILWEKDSGVLLKFRDEPELGQGGVFSILVDGEDRVGRQDFFRLYVQMSEVLGVVLMVHDKGFVTTRDFRKTF